MASIIRIKRSSGTAKPASLNWGEMAYVTGIGSFGGTNQYKDRIFLGDDGTNVNPIAGHFYTSMMEHEAGSIAGVSNTRNSDGGIVAILDADRKVDLWNVDNLRMDGNEISSQNTNGNITLNPNGNGSVVIPDDNKLGFGGGADGLSTPDATIEYDENGIDKLRFGGADLSTLQIAFDGTTQSTTKDTGSVVFEGGVGIEKNLNIGGNFNIGGHVNIPGHAVIDKIKIDDNVISSVTGSDNKIFIDPFPDGLSNEGDVIIKGNLQVDGTTTTINSTQSTVNDPIMTVGDVTSTRTVMKTVVSGVSTAIIDSVTGINVNDLVAGTSLPNSGLTTITSVNNSAKMITFLGTTSSGISTGSQFTITHAVDTNTDRGLSFKYNTGTGTANTNEGFFGLDDSSVASSTAGDQNHGTHGDDSRRWTYVPDGTITSSVVTGTKGFLDIKGIYYQTGDFASGGVVWFDSEGLQRSTNNPQSPVITSKQILTAITKNTLALSSAITVVAGDIIKQDSTGAFGIVETGVTGASSVDLIGVEGTFNTSNNLRKEGNSGEIANLASVPNTVSVIYTNKPHWTSTLDGGTF